MDYTMILLGVLIAWMVIKKLTQPKVNFVSKNELNNMLKDKKVKRTYVDVRTPDEFNNKNMKGFKNIPLHLLSKRHKEIPADQPVILICASGSRSTKAARILMKMGYKEVYSVIGGTA